MSLEPHQQRVVDEKSDLDERIAKLHDFKSNPIFNTLPPVEIGRLYRQEEAMRIYSAVLGERIAAFPPPEPKPEPPPVDRDQVVLTSGKPVPEDDSHTKLRADGMQEGYVVLAAAERAKGFVRPVRDAYEHIGALAPQNPLRDLTPEEHSRYDEYRYVRFETYPPGDSTLGRYWTQAQLDRVDAGCGAVTIMGRALAETYARDPKFYGGTFCSACGKHFPVGADGEFVWHGTAERVGT